MNSSKKGKVKVGIVGFGRMGITHFPLIRSHHSAEASSVADPSAAISSLLTKHVEGVVAYDNYRALIAREQPDALVVSTPPDSHYEIASYAANNGIHVFCEKPFTTNAKHAQELAELFSEKRLVGQVGYVNRFNDVFRTVKGLLKAGAIGKMITFKSEMYSATILKQPRDANWRGQRKQGGGALYEMATHAVDLIHYLLGPPDRVSGSHLISIFSREVEDCVLSTLAYRSGVQGTVNVNWSDSSYRKPTNKIEIFGDRGRIIADQHGFKVYLNEERSDLHLQSGWNSRSITDVFAPVEFYLRGNEFTAQLHHFINCIITPELPSECSFRDGAETLRTIEQIYDDFTRNTLK